MPEVLRSYPPVTAERLKQPEPQNWLMIRGNYSGLGYSALDQLTPANVAKLEPVWMMATDFMPAKVSRSMARCASR